MPSLIGNKPNQVPTNGDLGDLAFQDSNAVKSLTVDTQAVTNQTVTNSTVTTQTVRNPQIDTEISDIRPSLLLDFAKSKTLDPRITFTRATTATFYDGKTVAKAEENLYLYSQEFDNAYWAKVSGTATSNTEVAPDGTTTAETLTEAASGSDSLRIQPVSGAVANISTSGRTYTISCFLKAGTQTYGFVSYRTSSGNSAGAVFNLSTGAVHSSNAYGTVALVSSGISSVGNGWYRCHVVVTSGASVTNAIPFIGTSDGAAIDGGGYPVYTLSGKTIYAWGAQFEQRSAITAYTPTTTAPITNYIPALQTAAVNTPRFEHNPITGESLGLEIEEQRTNLLLRSEEFDNASWSKFQVTVNANSVISPDGLLSADSIIESTANSVHQLSQTLSITSGVTYVLSCYVKPAGRTVFRMDGNDAAFGGGNYCTFDLGTITVTNSGNSIGTITAVGNGWYRCTASLTAIATTSGSVAIVLMSGSLTSYTGDGYSGIYIWGAQLEAGAFPTSYIPTVASQVTRNADEVSIEGANFTSFHNGSQGTVYTDTVTFGLVDSSANNRRYAFALNSGAGSSANDFLFSGATTVGVFVISRNGGDTLTSSGGSGVTSLSNGQIIKSAISFNTAGISRVCNGINGADIVRPLNPARFTRLVIGNETNNIRYLNGYIKKLSYYPLKLTNAELQEMTL
jgi:hypothetical protein